MPGTPTFEHRSSAFPIEIKVIHRGINVIRFLGPCGPRSFLQNAKAPWIEVAPPLLSFPQV
jgi:hypothetical protein